MDAGCARHPLAVMMLKSLHSTAHSPSLPAVDSIREQKVCPYAMSESRRESSPQPDAAWMQVVSSEYVSAFHATVASRPSEEWLDWLAGMMPDGAGLHAVRIWPLMTTVEDEIEPGHLMAFAMKDDDADVFRISGVGTVRQVVSGRDAPRVAAIDADAEAFVLLDPFADWVANYTTADALWSFADLDERRPQRVHDQRVVDLLWLRQFLYGAEACRRQFVRSLNPYFAWLVRKQGTVPASRVEDAVQEIWMKLLQNDFASLRTFQARARLKTFVSVVARNAVVDFVRRLNLQPDEDSPIDLVADARVAPDTLMDERRLIGLGCRRLPLRQRRVLFLKYYLGYTAKEIAERLNTSVNTVDVTAHEARKRLAGIGETMTRET